MQPSPYTPGSVARNVPGRSELVAEFQERLSLMVDLRRMIPQISVAVGPRGIGKTSLLRSFERIAQGRDVMTVWVTAGDEAGLLAQLVEAVDDRVSSWGAEKAAAVRRRLSEISITLGVPGIATAKVATSRPAEATRSATKALKRLLVETAEGSDQGLLLFIDEIQAADLPGLRSLAYAWQELQAERPDLTAGVFAAGLADSAQRIGEAATFSERFIYEPIGMLSTAAQVEALREPAAALGVTWTPEAFELAAELAAGYPYAVQLHGDAAWKAAGRPDPGSSIERDHVAAGRERVEARLESMFEARWGRTTDAQKRFLRTMADLHDAGRPVRRGDLAQGLGGSTRALSMIRSQLIASGLIAPAGYGLLDFTVPGFADFVRRTDPTD